MRPRVSCVKLDSPFIWWWPRMYCSLVRECGVCFSCHQPYVRLLFAEIMSARPGKTYQQFEQALKYFQPERIAALYNELGRHECKINKRMSKKHSQNSKHCPDTEEWPLEFCIRRNYIKSAHYLVSLDLPLVELNCGLGIVLTKKAGAGYTELIKTLLKAGASVTSLVWFEQFTNRYQHKTEHSSEVLRSMCTIPADPASRSHNLGMFLHYCCLGSRKCQQFVYHRTCAERHRPDKSLFNITWYKTMEYLISKGLDLCSYRDQKVIDATHHYYSCCDSHYSIFTSHIDTSIMSLMLRLATGTTVTRQIFSEYAQQICNGVLHPPPHYMRHRPDIVSHEQDLLDLLPLFYKVGVDVCAPGCRLMFTGPRQEQYSSYIAFLKEQPRSLRDLACLRVRLELPGPNVMVSSQALTGLPMRIRDIIMLKTLDIARSLEPESVIENR